MKSGRIAIIGRPNVGKSTLVNRLIGEQLSIVTPKPQTTRQNIVGIYNAQGIQAVFLDTPGFHESKKAINKAMVERIGEALSSADVVVLMVEPDKRGPTDVELELFGRACKNIIIVINKIDTVLDEPWGLVVERYWNAFNSPPPPSPSPLKGEGKRSCTTLSFSREKKEKETCQTIPSPFRGEGQGGGEISNIPVIAVSAALGNGCDTLLNKIVEFLPEGEPVYPVDEYTEHTLRFLTAELIREQATLILKQELPYSLKVEVEDFKEGPPIVKIRASIIVEKESQKGIVIGAKGAMIKKIGTLAREKIEKLVGGKVYLELFVKVVKDWTKDEGQI